MLLPQIIVLKITGILPFYDRSKTPRPTLTQKVLQTGLTAVAVCFLIGTLLSSGLQGAIFLWGVFHPDPSMNSSETIFTILRELPFFFVNCRGFFVLLIFFIKRNSFSILLQETFTLIRNSFSSQQAEKLMRRFHQVSVVLFVVTVALNVLWESVTWLMFFQTTPNITFDGDQGLTPIPVKFPQIYTLFLTIFFRACPFIASQQIFVCSMVIVMVLTEAINELDRKIKEETVFFEEQKFTSGIIGEQQIESTESKVKSWEYSYLRLQLFLQSINGFFGLIFFLIYGMDFVAVLGFTSSLIQNSQSSHVLESTATWIFCVIVFLSYGTLFFWPLVLVYEKVSRRHCHFHRPYEVRTSHTETF
jgi:hypothetical protein